MVVEEEAEVVFDEPRDRHPLLLGRPLDLLFQVLTETQGELRFHNLWAAHQMFRSVTHAGQRRPSSSSKPPRRRGLFDRRRCLAEDVSERKAVLPAGSPQFYLRLRRNSSAVQALNFFCSGGRCDRLECYCSEEEGRHRLPRPSSSSFETIAGAFQSRVEYVEGQIDAHVRHPNSQSSKRVRAQSHFIRTWTDKAKLSPKSFLAKRQALGSRSAKPLDFRKRAFLKGALRAKGTCQRIPRGKRQTGGACNWLNTTDW